MVVLDCESYDSALDSIAKIYAATTEDVSNFLSQLSLSDYSQLISIFESRFGTPKKPDTICWFHLTRVPPGTSFSEGILPLHQALEMIWNTLISIPTNNTRRSNLKRLKKEGVPNRLYEMKTTDRLHSGPYAMFVKEVAFHADAIGNHDYLEFPEIIDDICQGYETKFGESIEEEIRRGLRKCIVKVRLPASQDDNDLIQMALLYCWLRIHDEELSYGSNTCFDGGSNAIPPKAIENVEFFD